MHVYINTNIIYLESHYQIILNNRDENHVWVITIIIMFVYVFCAIIVIIL